jgi:membrane associated rhomboid family serine protease
MLQALPPRHPTREPIFNLPSVVIVMIGVLVAVHGLRSVLSDEADFRLLLDFAFIPAQWTVAFDPTRTAEILAGMAGTGSDPDTAARLAFARYLLADPQPPYWSILTYALLHGSWPHVLLNSVWLAAFGTPVARRCGTVRFLALSAAAAVGGALAHLLGNGTSLMPMIGASAAVSGMMAAAARFVFSGERAIGQSAWGGQPEGQPRLSLLGLARNSRAALFIGIWFATNLLFGIAAAPLGILDASIAWEAHIGGFVVGLLLFPFLDRSEPIRFQAT